MPEGFRSCRAAVCLVGLALVLGPAAHAQEWWERYQGERKALVLSLPFDEGQGAATRDAVSGRDMALHNAGWTAGRDPQDKPIVFTGDNPITLTEDPAPAERTRFTVEVWCKPQTLDGGYLVLKKYAFGFPNFAGDGKVAAYLHLQNGKDWVQELPKAAEAGAWRHYMLVCDDRDVRLYVDGARAWAGALPASPAASAEPILLGQSGGWGKTSFSGELGLFRFYDAALSDQDAAEEHRSLRSGIGPTIKTAARYQLPMSARRLFRADDLAYEKRSFALQFDGTSACAEAAPLPALDAAEALTVGAWIRPDRTTPRSIVEQGYIASKGSGNHAGFHFTTYYQNGLAVTLTTEEGSFTASVFDALRAGEWCHAAFSWDGKALQIYVNGLPAGKPTSTRGRLKPYPGALQIGKASDRDGQYYAGAIDDVKVFTTTFGAALPPGVGEPVVTPASHAGDSALLAKPLRTLEGFAPQRPPLVDFEDLTGWTVTTYRGISEASLICTREETVYGDAVAKLTFKGGGYESPALKKVVLRPPKPMPIAGDVDAIQVWLWAAYWGKPKGVQLSVQVRGADGKEMSFPLRSAEYPFAFWSGWFLWDRALPAAVRAPAEFVSLTFDDFDGAKDEVVYLDKLTFYARSRAALPGRVPDWKDCPFPTTSDTILPALAEGTTCKNTARREGDRVTFTCRATDETVEYVYTPKTGLLSDITVRPADGAVLDPARDGGWTLPPGVAPRRTLQEMTLDGATLRTTWRWEIGPASFTTRMDLTAKGKSLVVDLRADTEAVTGLACGGVAGARNPLLVEVPYLVLRGGIRPSKDPAILSTNGVFMSAFLDWYNSEASEFYGDTGLADGLARINGGAVYHPKTDGRRNPPRERLFLTVSRRFAETLPVIPNPPNRWNDTTRSAVWATRMWYVSEVPRLTYFDEEYALYKQLRAYEVENLFIRHHVNLYRMYVPKPRGEPYSFVTRILPDIGGDAKCAEMFRKTRADLGYRIGLYTNHTLISPTNGIVWNDECVALTPDGNWRYGSLSAALTKVSRILELQEKVNPELKSKLGPSLSYLDQYTCPPLWRHTDYDARTPGAGTFGAALRVFGASLDAESRQFDGPVLSEGITQWMLAGLCDSYAQPGDPDQDTLVDFALERTHLLSNDCGWFLGVVASDKPEDADRLLAAELAYGHTGHLFGCYGGAPGAVSLPLLKSYFMIRQLQEYYATEPIASIRYHHQGRLMTTDQAIPAGALRNNQVALRYRNGLEVFVNRNAKETWRVTAGGKDYLLPPHGYVALLPGTLIEYSALAEGRRVDFVRGPAYLFCNGGGTRQDFGPIVASGSYLVKPVDGGIVVLPAPFSAREVISLDVAALLPGWTAGKGVIVHPIAADGTLGDPARAALDAQGRFDLPVDGRAFKYRLSLSETPQHM